MIKSFSLVNKYFTIEINHFSYFLSKYSLVADLYLNMHFYVLHHCLIKIFYFRLTKLFCRLDISQTKLLI